MIEKAFLEELFFKKFRAVHDVRQIEEIKEFPDDGKSSLLHQQKLEMLKERIKLIDSIIVDYLSIYK